MTLSDDDQRLGEELGRILGLLMGATLRAIDLYLDKGLADERLGAGDRRAIMNELHTVATAFRVADRYRGLLDQLTDELDPRPGLAVLRVVQDSLILSTSDDPADRSRRIPEGELIARVNEEPVKRFLDRRAS